MNKLLLLLFIVTTNAFAQMTKANLPKPGIITGKVIDQQTKEPLPYVNIIIKDAANKIITGGITDEAGLFAVKDIPEGKSTVEIQFIGYKTVSKSIFVNCGNKKINLGTISLQEQSTTLDEIVVRAEISTIVQKIDRKVINVGKDLTSAGATASELLNNIQSVSVDSQTGNISLRGNENVRVLVDGKPTSVSAAQLLQQIPSSSIKSIELITNPSAKYNPEGMSGIINIILIKGVNMGFNGNINTGVEAGHFVRYNGSLDMNYKTGKVNFFSNYGIRTGKRHNIGKINRPSTPIPTPTILQNFVFNNDNTSHLLKAGADIYINDKNTLSIYTTQNWNTGLATGSTMVRKDGTLVSNAPTISNSKNTTGAYNLNYKLDFDKKGQSLEFEANYSTSNAPEDAVFSELINPLNKELNYLNNVTNNRKNTLLNIDYTQPIEEKGKLEFGAEVRINNTSNSINTTQLGVENSIFDYDRNIFSSYVNYGHTFNKITMQLGARFEQYEVGGSFASGTDTAKVTDDIFSVYPSAFFTYNPSDKNQFQLSYSRRVDRPSISQINPIRKWSTPLITSIGNKDLKPQFTNSFELNYTRNIKGGSLTFGTFYRKTNDNISRTTYKDPLDPTDTRQILSYTNFSGNDRYGLELSANYRIAKWWRINSSIDFYAQTENGIVSLQPIEVKNEIFNARISNSFTATKNLRFQLFAMYRGPQNGIQFNRKSMWMINTGASLKVLKGKGNLTFRVNDIFKKMKFAFDSNNPFVQSGQFNGESQTTYLGFSYRFGGGKSKARARKKRDNNEKQGGGGFI